MCTCQQDDFKFCYLSNSLQDPVRTLGSPGIFQGESSIKTETVEWGWVSGGGAVLIWGHILFHMHSPRYEEEVCSCGELQASQCVWSICDKRTLIRSRLQWGESKITRLNKRSRWWGGGRIVHATEDSVWYRSAGHAWRKHWQEGMRNHVRRTDKDETVMEQSLSRTKLLKPFKIFFPPIEMFPWDQGWICDFSHLPRDFQKRRG